MDFIQVKACYESISHLYVTSLIPAGTELVQDYIVLALFLISFPFASTNDHCNRQDAGIAVAVMQSNLTPLE